MKVATGPTIPLHANQKPIEKIRNQGQKINPSPVLARPNLTNRNRVPPRYHRRPSNPLPGALFKAFQNMIGTTFGLIANMGLIFFVGMFIAVNPPLYRDGFARLFPIERRKRITEVMDQMSDSMYAWLNGRFIAMLITGVGTAIALWLLGVPMPISIGVITGLLTFIPNIGGIIALALAMMMALTQGPMTVVWVVVVYAVLQLVESNIVTPLVQQHQTSIPPALLLAFQIVLGALTGFLGLLVATPLLAAGLVGVQEFWIKDVLEEDSSKTQ